MKQFLGFVMLVIASGMFFMMLLPNKFVGFIIILALVAAGYHFFCSK